MAGHSYNLFTLYRHKTETLTMTPTLYTNYNSFLPFPNGSPCVKGGAEVHITQIEARAYTHPLELNLHHGDLGTTTLSRLVYNPYYELGHKEHPFQTGCRVPRS
jgi:hypothetical protein